MMHAAQKPITIVVGAQYGGEGKGKVAAYLASCGRYELVCRCGGVNSSHTVITNGKKIRLRLMPASATLNWRYQKFLFGAGTLLHIATLRREMAELGIGRGRVLIDPMAGIITEECVERQRADNRYSAIGSTLTGTGYASAERCLRRLPLARDCDEVSELLSPKPVAEMIFDAVRAKKRVLVEGHQGFGLSNYHGDYPYTSSRDSIAAAMMSELGIGPNIGVRVVMVTKIFPTRNHGGRLSEEITPEQAGRMGIMEFGGGSWGVQDNRRRVGQLDFEEVRRAVIHNTPDDLILTGTDYFDPRMRGERERRRLTQRVKELIGVVERNLKVQVSCVSTGPETEAMIAVVDRNSSQVRRRSANTSLFDWGGHNRV